ncbi:tRNA methyltransferase 10 homolog C [Clupea harengus]|uniref:tRNA methyltransferase 10 homolog C n=1 Tax=Clupea harengus TaxID=7950 RepID=A0A6P3VLH8_CLUHA|nr:tRNA methyltransferase 10 homolog C [Clupea harengus]
MRFVKLSLLNELRPYCHSLLPRLIVKKGYLPASECSGSSLNPFQTPVRSLCTSWPKWKDAPQPKDLESQKLDLDIWKSVMRSQVAHEETPRDSDDDAALGETGVMSKDSPLEATRELVEMWQQAGKRVPEKITNEQLEIVAEHSTKSAKKKYLKFLAIKEGYKKGIKEKQEKKRIERQSEREEVSKEDDEGSSKLRNSFLLPFWQRSFDKLLGWQSVQAMRFGQPLVFDMSYELQMTQRETENTISQLLESEGSNRRSLEPFHLHFCNLNPEGAYHKELLKRYSTETWENLMITASPQRPIDMFPREQLVYLTADSPNVLRTFDHNKVYVIGALVDRSNMPGVSLANAKRLKLATARLPLDEHLRWECGAKNLTLDQMFRILWTVKQTGSWVEALKFVPQRKHSGYPAKKGTNDYKGAEGRPTVPAKKFISKQHSRGGVESKTPLEGPIATLLKNKIAIRSDTHKARKNWWEQD